MLPDRPNVRRTIAFVALLTSALGFTGPAAVANAGVKPAHKPTAIVSLGDSVASGEAGGDYEADGHPFDSCNRSAHAAVRQFRLASIDKSVNLACSAATTDAIRLGGKTWKTERPQTEQLRNVARDNNVKLITLTVGVNDVSFANIVATCITTYAVVVMPSCGKLWSGTFTPAVAGLQAKAVRTMQDIRSVMRDAGYRDGDYQLIVQTYSSPVGTDNRYDYWARLAEGCPFKVNDMAWARQSLLPAVNRTLQRAAAQVPGVRVLDYTGAFDGREVCARGISHDQEWVRGMFIDLDDFRTGQVSANIVHNSLHPNVSGYAQIARCLQEFVTVTVRTGQCVRHSDGNLHAEAGVASG